MSTLKTAKWHQLVPISSPHITQSSYINPWQNSSASHVLNYSWLSACQGGMEPFEDHLSTHGCLTSLINKPQQKQPGQRSAPNLAELLDNVYSCHVMVKNVSCCCVCGSQLFSNPVKHTYLNTHSLVSDSKWLHLVVSYTAAWIIIRKGRWRKVDILTRY